MLRLQPIVDRPAGDRCDVTLRDHFAAAALTGLLAQGDDGSFSEESYVRAAYRWADAMLRERDKTSAEKTTGSGSVTLAQTGPDPDSRVWETQRTPQPHATPPQGSVRSEGSVENEPVAWAAGDLSHRMVEVHTTREKAENAKFEAAMGIACQEWDVFALYRHPQPTLTDAEREAIAQAIDAARGMCLAERWTVNTLRGLLERLK